MSYFEVLGFHVHLAETSYQSTELDQSTYTFKNAHVRKTNLLDVL
jgi:hypothetical protein